MGKEHNKFRCDNSEFDEMIEKSPNKWDSLPESVISTVIYFCLVEHNEPQFKFHEVLRILFQVGFPVYMVFSLQYVFILELYKFLPNFADDNNLCQKPVLLEISAISVFLIFLIPSSRSVITQSHIILGSQNVAYPIKPENPDDDDAEEQMELQKLYSPISKRIFVWLAIVLFEILVLYGTFIIGVLFILTAATVDSVILASVSVNFIMDIDEMARDAFETVAISQHMEDMIFETTRGSHVEHKLTRKPMDWNVLKTFSSIVGNSAVLVITLSVVFGLRAYYCAEEALIHDDLNNI